VQRSDLQRPAPTRHRELLQIDDQSGLVGIVLEFADRAPGAHAPAVRRLAKVPARDGLRVFVERLVFHRASVTQFLRPPHVRVDGGRKESKGTRCVRVAHWDREVPPDGWTLWADRF